MDEAYAQALGTCLDEKQVFTRSELRRLGLAVVPIRAHARDTKGRCWRPIAPAYEQASEFMQRWGKLTPDQLQERIPLLVEKHSSEEIMGLAHQHHNGLLNLYAFAATVFEHRRGEMQRKVARRPEPSAGMPKFTVHQKGR